MFKQLREDIACIYERDPAARSRWEILTCYPGLHAILFHRLSHRLWNKGFLWLARFLSHLTRLFTGIEIHPGAQIGKRVFFDHGLGIVIGETAVIGDDCTIYQGVTLGGTSLYKGTKRHPTLENGVVVGAGAQILGGFTVGAHAKIGSNAVVVKPVPAQATAVGNPARIITAEDRAQKKADETAPEKTSTPSPCQSEWTGKPLKELLERSTRNASGTDPFSASDAFSAYAVDSTNNDPLVQVLHELINHSAQQEQRISQLCHALEDLGKKIENGQQPLDVERLNKMME
ncbi:MAG TPA: serine O-acetyltransferase [Paenalcaligenes hominis]|uniref:Serine acetyltransferase n=1 Tax=Paenalcaligenes hominis TaxID=643674 RepID=A0A9D2VH56_9BURK|nr:serine O-acetyltransferase [Paenalcaligenes hominis]NJB64628.1 serine O-acetyltransferase [Paenalcaligenes hominis]GGE60257.1 serine acetyltransferase [Paenalcaligenes hominis]HJH24450.1 serine O-acetyltransferase [Paenalcaligenes hominis]